MSKMPNDSPKHLIRYIDHYSEANPRRKERQTRAGHFQASTRSQRTPRKEKKSRKITECDADQLESQKNRDLREQPSPRTTIVRHRNRQEQNSHSMSYESWRGSH